MCCLGWNIALFRQPAEREKQINRIWERIAHDANETPAGLEELFKRQLRAIVEQKLTFFPAREQSIDMPFLSSADGYDILCIQLEHGTEDIYLATNPSGNMFTALVEQLKTMMTSTRGEADRVQKLQSVPLALSDVERTQIAIVYSIQRADLVAYHRMLKKWQKEERDPQTISLIEHWLKGIAEMDALAADIVRLASYESASAEAASVQSSDD